METLTAWERAEAFAALSPDPARLEALGSWLMQPKPEDREAMYREALAMWGWIPGDWLESDAQAYAGDPAGLDAWMAKVDAMCAEPGVPPPGGPYG